MERLSREEKERLESASEKSGGAPPANESLPNRHTFMLGETTTRPRGGSTALLVIDIQRGAFDGARCPPIDRATELVRNARELVVAARESGAPIVFIQHCDEPGQAFEEGTPHWELHEGLSPMPDDSVVKKHASSAFENTDLGSQLVTMGIKELVVCGLQSECCVSNTSNSALNHGYVVRLAQDGHTTWPSNGMSSERISQEVNETLSAKGAIIEPTHALAARLRARA